MIYPGEGTLDMVENVNLDIQAPAHICNMLDAEGQQQNEDDFAVGVLVEWITTRFQLFNCLNTFCGSYVF